MGLSRTVSVINGVFRGKFQSSTPNAYNASTDGVSLGFRNGGGAQILE